MHRANIQMDCDRVSEKCMLVKKEVLEQIEDYADGQRYTGWVYSTAQDKYYYMVFYVSGDTVEGIRDQKNGLEYLYQNEN